MRRVMFKRRNAAIWEMVYAVRCCLENCYICRQKLRKECNLLEMSIG